MNYRIILFTVGRVLKVEAGLLLLPLITALCYRESCAMAFILAIMIALAAGFSLTALFRPKSKVLFIKEGFLIVALVWIVLSLVGALPFVISGEIPSFIDAFFETVSGFTTTGASILTDVEDMCRSMLFWRSFTHWIGGMGILVFVVMLDRQSSERSMNILRAEMPGPKVDKLVPRTRDTARILYLIYLSMTALQIILLLCGGMSLFDSVVHAFGTAGTGGFGIRADGLSSYSPYLQWVIAIFMLLFGVNFNVYYLILLRRFRSALKSTELWVYLSIAAAATLAVSINIYPLYHNALQAIRQAFFQVSSIITTTGYATADFNLWPGLSRGILFALLFLGGCAGSTAGGLKISRVILLFQQIRKELRHMLHPRSIYPSRFEGKPVSDEVAHSTTVYFALYCLSILLLFLLLSFEPFDLETNLTAAISCFNNVGPGLAAVGPMGGYSGYSPTAKLLLSLAMLMGRLEIYPMLLLFSPSTWSKR